MSSADDAAIRDAHDHAVAAGEPGYVDPVTGYFVFTAAELLARGECCGLGVPALPVSRSIADRIWPQAGAG